jgi:hypothetical protein
MKEGEKRKGGAEKKTYVPKKTPGCYICCQPSKPLIDFNSIPFSDP